MTKQDMLIDYLCDHLEGCTINELTEALKIPKNSIYNLKHHINNHPSIEYEIELQGNKYFIFDTSEDEEEIPETKENRIIPEASRDIPETPQIKKSIPLSEFRINDLDLNKIRSLPPADRADILDMIKKAIFYRKSAIALMESNEILKNIEVSI